MMPGFFKHMPPKKPGRWVASVIHLGRAERIVRRRTVTGLRRAYVVARLMALWDDFVTPDCEGMLEIQWCVQRERPEA